MPAVQLSLLWTPCLAPSCPWCTEEPSPHLLPLIMRIPPQPWEPHPWMWPCSHFGGEKYNWETNFCTGCLPVCMLIYPYWFSPIPRCKEVNKMFRSMPGNKTTVLQHSGTRNLREKECQSSAALQKVGREEEFKTVCYVTVGKAGFNFLFFPTLSTQFWGSQIVKLSKESKPKITHSSLEGLQNHQGT